MTMADNGPISSSADSSDREGVSKCFTFPGEATLADCTIGHL